MSLDKVMEARHSVRKFSSKKVNWRKIIDAIDSARLAPLAGNIPSLRFVIVDNKEKISQISEACHQQFVKTAQYLVIICSDSMQCVKAFGKRGEKYCSQQAGSAIENFLLKITDLGLATCWIGSFYDEQVKGILRMPDYIQIEGIFPIGYEVKPKTKQKKKPALDRIMFFNDWNNRHMVPLRKPAT